MEEQTPAQTWSLIHAVLLGLAAALALTIIVFGWRIMQQPQLSPVSDRTLHTSDTAASAERAEAETPARPSVAERAARLDASEEAGAVIDGRTATVENTERPNETDRRAATEGSGESEDILTEESAGTPEQPTDPPAPEERADALDAPASDPDPGTEI